MVKKAIFLDRDGCLIKEKNYLSKIEDIEIFDEAYVALKSFQDAGFLLFIVSNQSGVARGYFTENDVLNVNNEIINRFKDKGIIIAKSYYCPHLKEGIIKEYAIDCECRKPKIGLIKQAIADFSDIDLSKSFVIGDKLSDIQLAHNASMQGILVKTGHGQEEVSKIELKNIQPDYICENIANSADFILE